MAVEMARVEEVVEAGRVEGWEGVEGTHTVVALGRGGGAAPSATVETVAVVLEAGTTSTHPECLPGSSPAVVSACPSSLSQASSSPLSAARRGRWSE